MAVTAFSLYYMIAEAGMCFPIQRLTNDKKRDEALLWLKEALSIKKCKYINDSDLNKILISIYSKPKIYYELNYIFNKILYNLSFGNKRKTFKERSKYWHNKVRAYRKYNGFLPK